MKFLKTLGTSLALTALAISALQANTLRMADSTDIAAMDPHSMTESNTIGFLNHVFEGLVRYNDELKVEPAPRRVVGVRRTDPGAFPTARGGDVSQRQRLRCRRRRGLDHACGG